MVSQQDLYCPPGQILYLHLAGSCAWGRVTGVSQHGRAPNMFTTTCSIEHSCSDRNSGT